jgi:N-acyl-D-amino-acid deacylase
VGKVEGTATAEIDATGLVVAPGFVDVHTHAEDIEKSPRGENFVRMGVTSIVLGNCGMSRVNLGEFFRQLEMLSFTPNVASLIGHGDVRSRAMGGQFSRPPTEAELAAMQQLVEQAMRDGAVGLSTGLIYLPGTFATTEELIALAKVAAAHDGIYASHQRNEGNTIYASLEEFFRIAREAGIRAQLSHIKISSKKMWGQSERVLAALEAARAQGLRITHDQYVYPASSTGLSQMIPDEAREGGLERYQQRLADPAQKAAIVAAMKERLSTTARGSYDFAIVASCKHDRSLEGLSVPAAAKKMRGSDDLDAQIEFLLDLHLRGGGSGVFYSMDERDLEKFLRHPHTMFASDSGVRLLGEGVPHPRGYGNNARVLATYVREKRVLTLGEAIRKMTSLPAEAFGLKDRGTLRVGAWADIVVLDPARVQDHATFDDPHHYATGFAHVLVNGVEVVRHDTHTDARPGRILRHGAAGR